MATLNDSTSSSLRRTWPFSLGQPLELLQAAHNADPLQSENAGVRHVYDHFNGYSGRFTPQVVEQLRAMPEVDYIEKDQIVRTMKVQSGAPW